MMDKTVGGFQEPVPSTAHIVQNSIAYIHTG